MQEPIYKRVLIKISGEALAGPDKFGINEDTLNEVCLNIKRIQDMGVDVALVVGGGNFWRGAKSKKMDRTRADHMGMLATVINSLALADNLEKLGVTVRVQTAIEMKQIAEPYIRNRATRHLERKSRYLRMRYWKSFLTTDTAAALRAVEIDADVILLAKNVDGVYNCDPNMNDNAVKYEHINYTDVLNKGLGVMDSTATSLCMDNNIVIHVFAIKDPYNMVRAVCGEKIGTIVSWSADSCQ